MISSNSGLEAVADHFAEYGLTIEQLQDPLLWGRRPDTLIANIERVVNHFQAHGLTLKDYLQAAIKHPSFSHSFASSINDLRGCCFPAKKIRFWPWNGRTPPGPYLENPKAKGLECDDGRSGRIWFSGSLDQAPQDQRVELIVLYL
jgi:hypothetical protein